MAGEVERLIQEIEGQMKEATKELVAFRASDKRLGDQLTGLTAKLAEWQARAEKAVLEGNDDLAKEALVEKQRCEAEQASIARDRAEHQRWAAQLLKSRRELERRLTSLKLRASTVQTTLSAGKAGDPLATSGGAWDAMARVEDKLDTASAEAELDGELGIPPAELADAALHDKLKAAEADKALAELKKKMK